MDLVELLRQMLIKVSSQHTLLMGDFNFGDINWSAIDNSSLTEASKLFIEWLDDCFFTQHITQPTIIYSTTTLDLVITDKPDVVDDIDIVGNFVSTDRHMLKWTTVLNVRQIEYKGTSKGFSTADFDGIRHMLQQVNWEMVLDGEVEECLAAFRRILQNAIERFVPDNLSCCSSYKKARWITHRAVKCVRRKHNLYQRHRDVNNPKYIAQPPQLRG